MKKPKRSKSPRSLIKLRRCLMAVDTLNGQDGFFITAKYYSHKETAESQEDSRFVRFIGESMNSLVRGGGWDE